MVWNSGNSVNHDSMNKNGDWGGGTIEGNATITLFTNAPADPTPANPNPLPTGQDTSFGPFTGHVTEWFGGGGNIHGQSEGGFTFTFHGVSATGATVDVHQHGHMTFNGPHGLLTPTANASGGSITCS
jgi:hypothetical protein